VTNRFPRVASGTDEPSWYGLTIDEVRQLIVDYFEEHPAFAGVHNDLDGRDVADAHPMSAIQGLVAALAAKVGMIYTDWGLHIITNDVYPIAEINPAVNYSAFDVGGGFEFWSIPRTGVTVTWIHDEMDRTKTGIFVLDADAGTCERHPDFLTARSLQNQDIFTITSRNRPDGAPATSPPWRPINSKVRTEDALSVGAPGEEVDVLAGVVEWWVDEALDTETFNAITGYLQSQIETLRVKVDGTAQIFEPSIYPGVGRPLLMATDGVDGTGTKVRLIEVALSAPAAPAVAPQVVDIPEGWIDAGLGELNMWEFAGLLLGGYGAAADPDNTNTVVIPGGPFAQVYRPTVSGSNVTWNPADSPAGRTIALFDFSDAAAEAFGSLWIGVRTKTRFKTIVPNIADLPHEIGDGLRINTGHEPEWGPHTAAGVDTDSTGLTVVTGDNVQEQVESIDAALAAASSGGAPPWLVNIVPWASWDAATTAPTRTADSASFGGGWLDMPVSGGAASIGRTVSWKAVLSAGTWTIDALSTVGAAQGVAEILIGGVVVGTWDQYAASTTRNTVATFSGISIPTTGVYTLAVRVKSAGTGGGYTLRVQNLSLRRTA